MPKTANTQASATDYQPGRTYRVSLARAVSWRPGIVFRPNETLRMEGALLQDIAAEHPGAISEATDEEAAGESAS